MILKTKDQFSDQNFNLKIKNKRCAGCCDCCSQEVTIESPPGTVVGYVKQTGSFWKATYEILDETHNAVLKIVGPCCICDGILYKSFFFNDTLAFFFLCHLAQNHFHRDCFGQNFLCLKGRDPIQPSPSFCQHD